MTASPPRPKRNFTFWMLLALVVAVAVALAASNSAGKTFGLENEDLAQIAYLVAILAFVGSAFFGRGLGAGQVVRAIAGWVAIFLVLVGAYAYRTELTKVGARFLGVLAPGIPISGRLAGEPEAAVVIVRSIDGHFAVRAVVDDKRMKMLVDTGASLVTLTQEDAAKIGIDLRDLRFTLPIRTANGMIQAAPVTIDKLSVGSIERRKVPALVAPGSSLDQSLLGMSFLDTLKGYTISGDRLLLTP